MMNSVPKCFSPPPGQAPIDNDIKFELGDLVLYPEKRPEAEIWADVDRVLEMSFQRDETLVEPLSPLLTTPHRAGTMWRVPAGPRFVPADHSPGQDKIEPELVTRPLTTGRDLGSLALADFPMQFGIQAVLVLSELGHKPIDSEGRFATGGGLEAVMARLAEIHHAAMRTAFIGKAFCQSGRPHALAAQRGDLLTMLAPWPPAHSDRWTGHGVCFGALDEALRWFFSDGPLCDGWTVHQAIRVAFRQLAHARDWCGFHLPGSTEESFVVGSAVTRSILA